MARYLIEVPHEDSREACQRAIQTFLATGSHFLTHADWGCMDDEHKAWIIVDVESKQDALYILPPAFRRHAKIVALHRYSPEKIDQHKD